MLQDTLQKLFHPPPLAAVLLLVSVIFALPQQYKSRIFGLIDHLLVLDFKTLVEELPSPAQTWAVLLYIKSRFLVPLVKILLGWELDDSQDDAGNPFGSGSSSTLLYPLQEHRNGTKTAIPDRTKITSRVQLHQLHTVNATQGISQALHQPKAAAASSLHYVHGLVNTGNSCFLNSVLQALSALSVLSPYLESLLDRSEDLQLEEDDLQVTEALLDTMEALQKPLASHKAFRPRAIVQALESSRAKDSKASGYHSNIMNREQQDAQELFQIISSALNSEETTIQKLQSTRPLLDLEFLKKLIGMESTNLDHQVKKMESNPMIGMLASRLSCMQCGYTEAVRHFTFDNLSLSLPSARSCNIEDCLQQYITLESLNDVVCRKCSLIATLDRIGNELKQIDAPVGAQTNISRSSRRKNRGSDMDIDIDSDYLSDNSSTSFSESEIESDDESSSQYTSEFEELNRRRASNQTLTKAEKAVKKSKLLRQRKILEAAVKSDVEKAIPDIKLSKVVSRHCTKQVMLAKPPSVLCLHFIRSQYSNYGTVSKNSCHVRFPEYLDLSPFCTTGVLLTRPNLPLSISEQDLERMGYDRSGSSPSSSASGKKDSEPTRKKILYKLQSIVVHYGGHSYGHFIAYRRKPESMVSKVGPVGLGLDGAANGSARSGSYYGSGRREDWFRVSDETVESVSLENVLGSNPYMCLYEKVENTEDKQSRTRSNVTSSLSLQSVELGLRALLQKGLRIRTDDKEVKESQNAREALNNEEQKRIKCSSDNSSNNHSGLSTNESRLDPSRVDFMDMDEKLFKARPKAVAALLRMGHLDRDEDMSDMESLQSLDEDRAWRSFVSSPNSTTPPSPSAGSSDSSASPSLFTTSPVLRQRMNRKSTTTMADHSSSSSSTSTQQQQHLLNGLRIQSACLPPDLDLSLNGGASDSSSPPSPCIPEPFDILTSIAPSLKTKSASTSSPSI
ncbi:hypothetical protein BG015_006719 [Linnemannia schmuckeri]|uniref:Ubiquitin carboxyl-terminal hydrolase n=1 Tax=Linnemannia schmuckeri TaxID=64567 RepID=A0A9P5VBT7_9FUNG|nr:hypothetical protein BG015_006719 [Linnemannia schmuckeri]